MARMFICDLTEGDAFHDVLLVRDKQVRTNRAGGRYLQIELDDRSGSISARHWNSTDADISSFQPGDFLHVDGKVQSFQGQLQLIVHSFRRQSADGVRLVDFLPTTEKNIDDLEARLRHLLSEVRDYHLQGLVRAYLMDDQFMNQFRHVPAGVRNHHAYIGGLIDHVVTLLEIARGLREIYPTINHDLLAVGLFLHDSGKTRELTYERLFSYTDEGQLVGHIVQGVEILNEKLPLAAEVLGEPIPESLVLQVKHLILSHHGTYEFGSPRLPMTPEAIALHHLDNLDAKVHSFEQKIRETADPEARWSAYDPQMNRRIYKGNRPADVPRET